MNKLLMASIIVAILSLVVPVSVNANHEDTNTENLPICDPPRKVGSTCFDALDHDECIPISKCPEVQILVLQLVLMNQPLT
jgi:hypothetical protein